MAEFKVSTRRDCSGKLVGHHTNDVERQDMMITIDKQDLDKLEAKYPGVVESIMQFDEATLPKCSHCGSKNTASLQCGIVGRNLGIAAATTKIMLTANGSPQGKHYCNTCRKIFK